MCVPHVPHYCSADANSPYVIFEFPSNIALVRGVVVPDVLLTGRMKYFTPSKWISRIMVSWGIVTICTSAVSTYNGLIICRYAAMLPSLGLLSSQYVQSVSRCLRSRILREYTF